MVSVYKVWKHLTDNAKTGKAAVNRIKQHLGFRNEEQDDAQQWFAGIPPQALQVIQEFYQYVQDASFPSSTC